MADIPQLADPATGELIGFTDIGDMILRIDVELQQNTEALKERIIRQFAVEHFYELTYMSAVVRSNGRSEDRRKAEAVIECSRTKRPDAPVDVATERLTLEIEVKALREEGHNLRARLSGLQTLSSNMRAELSASISGERYAA